MKKVLIRSLLAAFAITLVLFGIDTFGALKNGDMLISIEQMGGDCSVDRGIGWSILHLYPVSKASEAPVMPEARASFDFLSIAVVFLTLWFFMGLVFCLFSKKYKQVLMVVGGIAAILLIWFGISKIRESVGDIPTELVSVRVYTADMHPGSCYAVLYPDQVCYFVPAGEDGKYGHTRTENLYLRDHVQEVTKAQLKRLINAAKAVKEKTGSGSRKDFAFRIEINYKTVSGSSNLYVYGRESFPACWDELAEAVNDICGQEYMSKNPQKSEFSKEWFIENFGVTEQDMPEDGNLDGFINYYKIDMEQIAGSYKNGRDQVFDVQEGLRAYEQAFTRVTRDYMEEKRAKEALTVPSAPADFRDFAYAYADKLGCREKADYIVPSDKDIEYVKFPYETDMVYVFRSDQLVPVTDSAGGLVSERLDGIGGDGRAPIYYDNSGRFALVTKSTAKKVYEVFFEMGTDNMSKENFENETGSTSVTGYAAEGENDGKLASLDSLKAEAPEDMYSMTYYNSCCFDKYLEEGYKGTEEWISFVTENIVGSMMEYEEIKNHSCSAFICRNEKNDVLYCRNFDIEEISPCCMLTTVGKDGYRSIGGTDISLLYNASADRMELSRPNNLAALALPYRTHDGMNEYGVAMSILRAGRGKTGKDDTKKLLSCLDVIRLVLEKAQNVDEAIELLNAYNVDMGSVYANTPFHYFLADASGRAVVVEYGDGVPVIVESNYVTNFNLEGAPNGVGRDRYDIIEKTLNEHENVLSEQEALELLASVVMKGLERYSVIYNLTTGDVTAFSHGDCTVTATFHLDMK